jgi:hypothetical protein
MAVEHAARELSDFLQRKVVAEADRVPWEFTPEWQREEHRKIVRCVLAAHRSALAAMAEAS